MSVLDEIRQFDEFQPLLSPGPEEIVMDREERENYWGMVSFCRKYGHHLLMISDLDSEDVEKHFRNNPITVLG